MLQLGTKASQPREMILDDIYLLRLKLLLHMAKDCLEGRDFSDLRRQIVLENARHIQIESIELGCLDNTEETVLNGQSSVLIDCCFYRSARDLAALMELIAKGQLADNRIKNALQENFEAIRHIQNTMYFSGQLPGNIDEHSR
jgi:hypothetical protein